MTAQHLNKVGRKQEKNLAFDVNKGKKNCLCEMHQGGNFVNITSYMNASF